MNNSCKVIEHVSPTKIKILFTGSEQDCDDYYEEHKWDGKTIEMLHDEIGGDNSLYVFYQEEPEPETMKQYIKDIAIYAVFCGSVLALAYAVTEAIFT